MHMIDWVLVQEIGFSSTVYDKSIYCKIMNEKFVLLLGQVDNSVMACNNENITKQLTTAI